jgi:cytochrome c-type biogenesis protein CcmE
MPRSLKKYAPFISATVIIAATLGYLGYSGYAGAKESMSYYMTIAELKQDQSIQFKRVRVAGSVVPGSIARHGLTVEFKLQENELTLPVTYQGTEAPPDTFKDDSQALVEGEYGKDGVFHANHLQAKCASKYAPKQSGS